MILPPWKSYPECVNTAGTARDTGAKIRKLQESVATVIRGKSDVIRKALISLLARGHLLIEDVPGVGKTTLAHALARSVDCTFHRIQFTSDLLPTDLTGVSIFNQLTQEFDFRKGPLFANVVLADEINRTTPKTQSALLEAMSEGRVTVEDRTHELPRPFIVIATQNPVEHHGTYPLPESQLDRFVMRIRIGYPGQEDEKDILRNRISPERADRVTPVLSIQEILEAQDAVESVEMGEELLDYLLTIVNSTRNSEHLQLGISPRGASALYGAAQASAFLEGRDYCIPDDIKSLAVPIFAHRVIVSPNYSSPLQQTQEAESILAELLEQVKVPL